MNNIINYMLQNGVPDETLIFLLLLPMITTLIVFGRQILGIKAFGIYIPLIVSLAFLSIGIRYGLIIFAVVIAAGTIARLVLKRLRLLYLPRIAIILIAVAMSILLLFWEGAYSGRTTFIATSIFPALIIIILVEKFIAAQIERGAKTAITLTLETLILAIAGYYLGSWGSLRNIIIRFPELAIIGSIAANILLGRWAGLRLNEYFRFREVFKKNR